MVKNFCKVMTLFQKFHIKILIIAFMAIICACDSDDIAPDDEVIVPGEESVIRQSDTINLSKTDILATSGDNILRLTDNDKLLMSNDLGKTWKSLDNTIGIISAVHWFSDQSCLICSRYKAYWVDKSFSTIHESIVYDYDGSVLSDTSPHFYLARRGHDYSGSINGVETFIWSDYFGEVERYVSRVWQTTDNGKTIKCICKNNETVADNGEIIKCRHFHDCIIRENHDEIYITSGDSGSQCQLIKGTFRNGKWSYHIIGKGKEFKFCGTWIKEPYFYTVTDYTGYSVNGLLKVEFTKMDDINNYHYVYKAQDNKPLVGLRKYGKYIFLGYDGSVTGKMIMSVAGGPFHTVSLLYDGSDVYPGGAIGLPNNAGLSIINLGITYGEINDMKLNGRMYNFTEAMHAAGYLDYGQK